jgi:50S ribosomal protein L16 3-hydroxylase
MTRKSRPDIGKAARKSGTSDRPLQLLGGLSATQFFQQYWHKKPLLIRQAIPDFKPAISVEDLFSLAADPHIESRLIRSQRGRWNLSHGPFSAGQLPTRRQRLWTLLVQGVNLHHAAANALLEKFRFIPDTRLDDVMISFATDGGGVGPHFDSYDVFLLQAAGQREWEISSQRNLDLLPNQPLKILRDFTPQQRWVLEPGDMLYLPPHIAHNGIALGDCMTWSIGFRAPSHQELGLAFLEYLTDTIELPGRYADPKRQASKHPAQIDDEMLEQVSRQLERLRWTDKDVANFLGEYLSTPKPATFFVPRSKALTRKAFERQLARSEIVLDPKTIMLYRTPELFINGESFTARGFEAGFLKALANQRHIQAHQASQSEDLVDTLYDWYRAAWIDLK